MDMDAIIAGLNHTIKDFYFYHVQLKEGVVPFLKGMQQVGIKIVAATSCERQVFEKALTRLKAINYFDKIFTCTELASARKAGYLSYSS